MHLFPAFLVAFFGARWDSKIDNHNVSSQIAPNGREAFVAQTNSNSIPGYVPVPAGTRPQTRHPKFRRPNPRTFLAGRANLDFLERWRFAPQL
jgi:hypothetical protein